MDAVARTAAEMMIARSIGLLVAGALVGACNSWEPPPTLPADGRAGSPAPTLGRSFIVGCKGVDLGDCDALVGATLAKLEASSSQIAAIEVEYPCPGDASGPCPTPVSEASRTAIVFFSLAYGPAQLMLSGPLHAPRVEVISQVCPPTCWAFSVPGSARANLSGPFPYALGRCGLSHVDFDGGFWVPIGQIVGDPAGPSSGTPGLIYIIGPDLVEYREDRPGFDRTFAAQLARYPGSKFVEQRCA